MVLVAHYAFVLSINFLIFLLSLVEGQFIHPTNDKLYLDTIEENVKAEVEAAAVALEREAGILQNLTAPYIVAMLRRNVNKALAQMSESEREETILTALDIQKAFGNGNSGIGRPKTPKQETETDNSDPSFALELGTLISGIVFRNLKVVAYVPNIFVESLRKSFPNVFGHIFPTTTTTTTPEPEESILSLNGTEVVEEKTTKPVKPKSLQAQADNFWSRGV